MGGAQVRGMVSRGAFQALPNNFFLLRSVVEGARAGGAKHNRLYFPRDPRTPRYMLGWQGVRLMPVWSGSAACSHWAGAASPGAGECRYTNGSVTYGSPSHWYYTLYLVPPASYWDFRVSNTRPPGKGYPSLE